MMTRRPSRRRWLRATPARWCVLFLFAARASPYCGAGNDMPRVAVLQHSRGWRRASHRHYAMAQILLRRVHRAEGICLLSPMSLRLAPHVHTTHSPLRVTLRAVHGVARFVFQRWTCHATRRARKREQLRDSADWNAVRLMSDCLRDQNDPETFLAGGPAEVCECVAHMIVLYIFAHPVFCSD